MLKLRTEIPNSQNIKNIIFDFGGVICDIDVSKTEQKFLEFGESVVTNAVTDYPSVFNELVVNLEKGKISSESFINAIQRHYLKPPSAKAVMDAWNALLGEIPNHRIELLKDIRNTYGIYLLSNTNIIHYNQYLYDFQMKYGIAEFEAIFKKLYLSFQIGYIKPGRELFDYVIEDGGFKPATTLFIDDTPENVEGSIKAGLQGYYLNKGRDVRDLFTENHIPVKQII